MLGRAIRKEERGGEDDSGFRIRIHLLLILPRFFDSDYQCTLISAAYIPVTETSELESDRFDTIENLGTLPRSKPYAYAHPLTSLYNAEIGYSKRLRTMDQQTDTTHFPQMSGLAVLFAFVAPSSMLSFSIVLSENP